MEQVTEKNKNYFLWPNLYFEFKRCDRLQKNNFQQAIALKSFFSIHENGRILQAVNIIH